MIDWTILVPVGFFLGCLATRFWVRYRIAKYRGQRDMVIEENEKLKEEIGGLYKDGSLARLKAEKKRKMSSIKKEKK